MDWVVALCAQSANVSQAITLLKNHLTLSNPEFSPGVRLVLEGFIEGFEDKCHHQRDPEELFYDKLLLAQDVADRRSDLLDLELAGAAFMRAVRYFRSKGY